MKLTDLDLTAFRYNPAENKELQRLREEHPEAFGSMLYENKKLINFYDEILRYIILVYDLNSPIMLSTKTHNECKVKSMLMSGFEANESGEFNQEVRDALLLGKDTGIAKMVVKYVYIFNNVDYAELMGMIEFNSQTLAKIQNHKTDSSTMKNLKDTSARIRELTSNIFGGKETREIEEQLYEQLSMSRISLRPERMVRQLASGKSEDVFAKDIYKSRKPIKKIVYNPRKKLDEQI